MQNRLRFALAIIASLIVHGAILIGHLPPYLALRPTPPLQVELRPPAAPAEKPAPSEPLLKNNFAEASDRAQARPAPPPPPTKTKPRRLAPQRENAVLRKLNKYLYYPLAANDAGIEGTVVLLLRLDARGNILDVDVAAGSGHAILDEAALQAVRSTGSLGPLGISEFLLPVEFHLQ